jgi:hypothetical protein
MKFKIILFLVFAVSGLSFSQDSSNQSILLTGNLKLDADILGQQTQPSQKIMPNLFVEKNKKSPFLASVFSLILPGSGELYAKSYLKAGIFAAVEATLITVGIIYNKKGDNQTDTFQKYADENWSVVKYAKWMVDNKDFLGLPSDLTYGDIITNDNPNLAPWQQVNFGKLNFYEDQVTGGSGFTHKLPDHGEQQYYELIGKYHQYNPGWDDYNQGTDIKALTPHFVLYSGMRGDANDLYNVSTKAVVGIYINHVLSALDAAWTTSVYNKEVAMQLRVKQIDFVDHTEFVPTVNLKVAL